MTAAFHTSTSLMTGIDAHPLDGPPVPHFVFTGFFDHAQGDALTTTVTADGRPLVRQGHANAWVLHVPLALPATPKAAANFTSTMLSAKSKPTLHASAVRAQGRPLAISWSGSWGLNLNCNAPFAAPGGHTLALTSVITTPTVADVGLAVVRTTNDMIESFVSGQVTSRFRKRGDFLDLAIKQFWKRAFSLLPRSSPPKIEVPDVGDALRGAVGEVVDAW